MHANPSAQRRLLEVADLDMRLVHLRHNAAHLPENDELKPLQAQRVALTEQITEADTRRGDAQTELDRIESDIAPAKQRLERNQQRSESGEITEQRAMASLQAEIDHLKGRINDLEELELETMQQVEDETARSQELVAQRSAIENSMRALLAKREQRKAEITAQAKDLTAQAQISRKDIPEDLLALYDRIASKTGSSGAAELKARRCGGCGLEIDPAELRQYAAEDPETVLRCEECGRILVRTENSGLN